MVGPSIDNLTYSQYGEDRILYNMLGRAPGFYVDVGAHHPHHLSNTYLLYCLGWRGIVIDPLRDTRDLFGRERPRDIAVECGCDAQPSTMTYFEFTDPAWNTFSTDKRDEIAARGFPTLTGQRTVPVRTLEHVLAEHLPEGERVDVLNCDVEGKDLAVLEGNDWDRFRPRFVVVEDGDGAQMTANEALDSLISRFLREKNFAMVGLTNGTAIWQALDQQGRRL